MEIHNARFEGELKQFGERMAQSGFFDRHPIFSANEVRRMRDVNFALVFIVTVMSTYFNRDDELESALSNYNDEFPEGEELEPQIMKVFDFVDQCDFGQGSRVWKLSDLLSLLVETHRVLVREGIDLDPSAVSNRLKDFYQEVDWFARNPPSIVVGSSQLNVAEYARAASQATNDRGSRIKRGEIIRSVLLAEP